MKVYKRKYDDRTNFYIVEGEVVLCLSTFCAEWEVRTVGDLYDLESNAEISSFSEMLEVLQ